MRRRTQAREFAMQVLYQMDITHDDCDACLNNFWHGYSGEQVDAGIKEFTDDIVKGVATNLTALDEKISRHATNWQLSRMAVVDRNILRMGAFELIFCLDIPPKVSINEAVDLAKKYSGLEAGKFVNAILDKIKQEMKR
jgi:transcription antitermination factor NusB